MVTSKPRLPSRDDLLRVYAVCAFPIFIWAIINLLWDVQFYLLRATVWEVWSIASYILADALFESVVACLILVVVAAVLPTAWFRVQFVAVSAMLFFITVAWAIATLYFFDYRIAQSFFLRQLTFGLGFYLLTLILGAFVVLRVPRIAAILSKIADRLVILSFVYTALGVLGVLTIVIRNI